MAYKAIVVEPVDFDFDVQCNICGKELSADFDRSGTLNVEPCETCMENKYNEGFKDGEPI